MPLHTQILRNGESVQLRWGDFHIAAMTLAAACDAKEGKLYELIEGSDDREMMAMEVIPLGRRDAFNLTDYGVIAATPLNDGSYTLKGAWTFEDRTDGEIFKLLPGDELRAWRMF